MFTRKFDVTILNENWHPLINNLKLVTIPKKDDFMYFDTLSKYYKIINVIHQINKKHNILLIVKEYTAESLSSNVIIKN
jgi:hypothetical protein